MLPTRKLRSLALLQVRDWKLREQQLAKGDGEQGRQSFRV